MRGLTCSSSSGLSRRTAVLRCRNQQHVGVGFFVCLLLNVLREVRPCESAFAEFALKEAMPLRTLFLDSFQGDT